MGKFISRTITIGFVLCGICFVTCNFYDATNIEDTPTNEINQNNNMLSMMLETDSGSGQYEMTSLSSWPTDGYVFNSELSKCENGSKLSWDETNKQVVFSGIITDKLATYSDPTASTGIRLMDLVNGIGLCAVRPIFGMGFGTTMIKAYENAVGIGGNSNGIILMFYAMGSIFGVVYLYLMSKGVISFFEEKNKIKKIIYVVIFVILQATECIFIFPVYILFLYEHNGEKANEERRRSISFADILTRINDTLRRKKNGIEE